MTESSTALAGTSSLQVRSLATRTEDGLDAVQWRRHDGTIRTARPSPELLHERLWESEQIRRGVQYQNRLNQHGLYYWPRTGRHVWYESALELACLVDLDYQGKVVQVAAQPFRLLFRRGAEAVYHDPDFFAVHANGDQVVYDVKPAARINEKARQQFAATAVVCADVGWRYEVLSETHPTRTINLGFLRPTRLPRCHPSSEVFVRLLDIFEAGRFLGEGAAMVNRRRPALAMPYIKHLIWHRHLSVDLDQALDFDTTATTTSEGEPCCG